jgi:putative membrane protein
MKITYFYIGLMAGTLMLSACDDDDNDDNSNETPLTAVDDHFVEHAIRGNYTEVNFGELASDAGSDSLARAFGEHMVMEHSEANDELKEIADDYDDVEVIESLDAEHQAKRNELEDRSGWAFDSLYMASQIMDHEKTIELFENEISNGENDRVKAYANKYLPHIKKHYSLADSIMNVIMTEMPN